MAGSPGLKFVVLILAVWLAGETGQLKAEEADQKARAVFPVVVHDFGTVAQGKVATYDFSVLNKGGADLIIQRVVAACGCTAASSSDQAIKPGEQGSIRVQFDTANFSGSKTKTVRVYSNDPEAPVQTLTIKGIVEPDVLIEPRSLFFGDIVRGTPAEPNSKTVGIKVRPGAKVKLGTVKSFSPYLIVDSERLSETELRLTVSIDPAAPGGELRERLAVRLSGSRENSVNVPVFAAIKSRLSLKPPQLSFGVLEGQAEIVRKSTFEVRGPHNVQIKEVNSNNPAVQAGFEVIEPGKRYVIEVRVDPSKVARDLRSTVEITTDSQEEGTVSLNVYGILPPRV